MKRNKFSLSHYKLFSCSQGELVPATMMEVLPGDSIQHATSMLVRVLPLLAPVMHPVRATIHHWFVPHRLVWDEWEDFITGGPDGMDASVFPTIYFGTGIQVGTLGDYLGLRPGGYPFVCSALPYRGYALIFNEWYRDQDLQSPLPISTASGVDTTTNIALVNRCWEKDYFTSSRPWEQKGPAVSIPLAGDAPVLGIGKVDGDFPEASQTVRESDQTTSVYANASSIGIGGAAQAQYKVEGSAASSGWPNIRADLSGVTAVNINDLRLALALQRYEEARARYGSRYVEYLRYLGVRSSDARLQRPEYLGGGKQPIQFSEVLQTAPTTDGDDSEGVGNLKGHGIGFLRSNRYRRFFEEHGYVFTLINVQPKTMYVQGMHRTWNRRTKEDFWQKELEHIGQQEVLKKEVYVSGSAADEEVFGYQDRYDEYRRMESSVAGEFRTTLDFWHMARNFASMPSLNASFVSSNPTNRIYSVTDDSVDKLWIMTNHSIQARRMLSKTGTSFTF